MPETMYAIKMIDDERVALLPESQAVVMVAEGKAKWLDKKPPTKKGKAKKGKAKKYSTATKSKRRTADVRANKE